MNPITPAQAGSGRTDTSREQTQYLAMRCLSTFVDAFVVGLPACVVYALMSDVRQTLHAYMANPYDLQVCLDLLHHVMKLHGVGWVIYVVYGAMTEGSALMGTLGKRVCGLRVLDREGRRIGWGRSLARNLLKTVSHIPLDIGFVWIFVSKHQLAWHDMLAGTQVRMASVIAPGDQIQ